MNKKLGCLARLCLYTHLRPRGKWVIGCVFAMAFVFEWDNGRMDVEMLEERKGGVWDAEDGGLVEQEGERVEVEEMLVGLIGILQMAIGDQICR